MSIFTRVADIYRSIRYVNSPEFKTLQAEFRTYSQTIFNGVGLLTGYNNTSGEPITAAMATRVATWFTCLQVRWDAVGMLPFQVIKKDGRNKILAVDHPAYDLLACRPNAAMTATQFWKAVQMRKDNFGNAYCPITRDRRGNIIEIGLIENSEEVQVYAKGYELFYKYRGEDIASSDILHFKGYSSNGKAGLSLAEHHAETLGRLRAINRYSNRSISTNPGIYATSGTNNAMGEKQLQAFKDYWAKQIAGYGELGEIPVLYGGYDMKTVGINPKDALYLEQIQATKEDIYGITKVSPSLAKNYNSGNTYNNGEQQNLDFLIWTLQPLLKDIEEECDYKLFTAKERQIYSCKFNEKAIMRTDAKTQADWLTKIFGIGGYSINDVLEYLDENPIDNEFADDHFVPANNLVPLSMMREYIESKAHGPVPESTEKEPADGSEVPPGNPDDLPDPNDPPGTMRKVRMNGHQIDNRLKKHS